jgi:hypothetical protein
MGRRERRRDERETRRNNKRGADNLASQLDHIADNMATSFGARVDQVKAEAKEGGEHGVMIVGTDDVYVSDLVPFGRVWHAGSEAAVEELRNKPKE